MPRSSRHSVVYSRVSVKNRTVLPRAVRDKLDVKPGDTLRYRLTEVGVQIDKAPYEFHDPFVVFSEWSGPADERVYADL